MADLQRMAAIRSKTQEVLAKAKELYGVDIKPTISFNLRGRVAGWAGCKFCRVNQQRVYTLRYNRDCVTGNHFEDMRDETVPHEVAHLVCYARPELGRKHDAGWRRICLELGGNGNTRHDYAVTYAHGGWDYIATCGTKVAVSNIIHQRIQAGQGRVLRKTGGKVNRWCRFARQGSTMPASSPNGEQPAGVSRNWELAQAFVMQHAQPQQTPQPVQATVRPVQAISKAEQVRAWIREAKRSGNQPSSVVIRAINVLNMARSQATKYVSENWARA